MIDFWIWFFLYSFFFWHTYSQLFYDNMAACDVDVDWENSLSAYDATFVSRLILNPSRYNTIAYIILGI